MGKNNLKELNEISDEEISEVVGDVFEIVENYKILNFFKNCKLLLLAIYIYMFIRGTINSVFI